MFLRSFKHFGQLLSTRQFGFIKCYCHCSKQYEMIVVGGGRVGIETCFAAARMGAFTSLLTHKKSSVGEMSCNPSFGGIVKGHLMSEVDALDRLSAKICDLLGIHYKVLHRRKDSAVRSLRAQVDRKFYKMHVQAELLEDTPNLDIIEGSVDNILLDNDNQCTRVLLENEILIRTKFVILTTGIFLNGEMTVKAGGRIDSKPPIGLANTLKRLGFNIRRMKTGTPPSIEKKIN